MISDVVIGKKQVAGSREGRPSWYRWEYLPLLCALVLALVFRVCLILHVGGMLDGDEALVGMQANHILQGERPLYFYAQAYMGNLEAYIIALLSAIFGSSVWIVRAETGLMSLVVVGLTWQFSRKLALDAQLSPRARYRFQTMAVLFAALTPLYDLVLELRALGGYSETFVIMLLLLLFTQELKIYWQQKEVRYRELLWRWALIGFTVGLGIWIDPLFAPAGATLCLWTCGIGLSKVIHWKQQGKTSPRQAFTAVIKQLTVALVALPALCIGAAPALKWGASHRWANFAFIFIRAGSSFSLTRVLGYTQLYTGCVGKWVIGGALPGESKQIHFLHTLTLAIGAASIAATIILILLSFLWPQRHLVMARRLALLPLAFGLLTFMAFTIPTLAPPICLMHDTDGRFATPLMLVLPFLFSVPYAVLISYLDDRRPMTRHLHSLNIREGESGKVRSFTKIAGLPPLHAPLAIIAYLLLVLQVVSLGAQAASYVVSSPNLTFQSPFCMRAPANIDPIIAYMQREHIRYAWASSWIAQPIMFKTHEQLLVGVPGSINQYVVQYHVKKLTKRDVNRLTSIIRARDRQPNIDLKVMAAKDPSYMSLVPHGNLHSPLLALLDALHVKYRVVYFPSQPGFDVLVATPLNQTVTLDQSPQFSKMFGCEKVTDPLPAE